jgi:hypothetical protein
MDGKKSVYACGLLGIPHKEPAGRGDQALVADR